MIKSQILLHTSSFVIYITVAPPSAPPPTPPAPPPQLHYPLATLLWHVAQFKNSMNLLQKWINRRNRTPNAARADISRYLFNNWRSCTLITCCLVWGCVQVPPDKISGQTCLWLLSVDCGKLWWPFQKYYKRTNSRRAGWVRGTTEEVLCAEHETDFLFRDHVGRETCALVNGGG